MDTAMKVIDRDLALERAGGNADLADELFQMLLKELPVQRHNIERAYRSGDMQELFESAHKLKGSATYCGVPALREAAGDLSDDLKHGNDARVDTQVTGVLTEIDRVLAAAE